MLPTNCPAIAFACGAARMAWAWAQRKSGREGPDSLEGSMPTACGIFQTVEAQI